MPANPYDTNPKENILTVNQGEQKSYINPI